MRAKTSTKATLKPRVSGGMERIGAARRARIQAHTMRRPRELRLGFILFLVGHRKVGYWVANRSSSRSSRHMVAKSALSAGQGLCH